MEAIKWVLNKMSKSDDKHLGMMSTEQVSKAQAFHRSFPQYAVTPLARLEGLTQVALYQCDLQDLSPLAKIPTLEGIYISGGSELLPCDFTPLKRLTGFSLRYNRCPPSKAGNTFWASSGKSWASKRWGSPPGRSRPPLRRSGNGWRSWASPLALP